jgi:DUF4097 and DUF4098 domain-containing protein YvlB
MLIALLLALSPSQAPFDTTIAVRPETRPERGAMVVAELQGTVLDVRARTPGGGFDLVSWEITVPRRMGLTLGRGDLDITVHGTEGPVDANISSGFLKIEGGRGIVALRSFQGPIELRGARAAVTVESSLGQVTLTDVAGDVDVRSNSSHVTLQNVDTRNLRAGSIGGVIRFSGPLHPDGHYALTAHSGSVWVKSPVPINATVSLATVSGGFSSRVPYTVTDRRRQGIFTARFGEGGAQVSMESFSGGLVIEELKPM